MCVHLSTFRRTAPFLFFFQFSLLFSIKIKNFYWIRLSCHLLNDISKNCNFYWIPLSKQTRTCYKLHSNAFTPKGAGGPPPPLIFVNHSKKTQTNPPPKISWLFLNISCEEFRQKKLEILSDSFFEPFWTSVKKFMTFSRYYIVVRNFS